MQRQRDIQRQRDRDRDRQRNRQREAETETERETERKIERERMPVSPSISPPGKWFPPGSAALMPAPPSRCAQHSQ